MSMPPIRSPQGDTAFFAALENGHNVRAACEAAGYARSTVYRWRREDDDFAKLWLEALGVAADLLEEEADRRGRDGYDEPVFHRGEQCGAKRKYSDGLLLARLKALRPHQYRENVPLPPQNVTIVIQDFLNAKTVPETEKQPALIDARPRKE
ncbi:MAG: helix-turn-helix domain-containing protein [Alphaproteobacteria bacterium]|nr:helix-turn-helix domain-containing protein [Alphaproteobacteria bacterium]